MGAKAFRDNGPAHKFWDGEGFEELVFVWNKGVAGIGVDAV